MATAADITNDELMRLTTYSGYKGKLSVCKLAKQGFLYDCKNDYILCCMCSLYLPVNDLSWDLISQMHAESVNCKFALGDAVVMPVNDSDVVPYKPKLDSPTDVFTMRCMGMIAMKPMDVTSTLEARIRSFDYIHTDMLDKLDVDGMVDAGFFYSDNRLVCYFCSLTSRLSKWPPQRDPWVWHAFMNKNCGYVLCKKGYETVNIVHQVCVCHDYLNVKSVAIEKAINDTIALEIKRYAWEKPKSALELYVKPAELNDEEEIAILKHEIEEYKKMITCIICFEKQRNIVLCAREPEYCEHIVVCSDCVFKIKQCPLCRTNIFGVIRLVVEDVNYLLKPFYDHL